jgi:hypothetical protein
MSTLREQLRKALLASYTHRFSEGTSCALCGASSRPLAFHMLEASIYGGAQPPTGFVPMAGTPGRVRGSFPICTHCAPPCKKCGLPIPTEKVLELRHRLKASTGVGVCQDIQWRLFAAALLKRLLGIGRFSRKSR